MSLYVDIYNELPLRCADVWQSSKDVAKENGREVSLMIMAATAGLATPWDQLRIDPGQTQDFKNHPAFDEKKEWDYKRALKKVKKAVSSNISSSSLFYGTNLEHWYFCQVTEITEIRKVVEYRDLPNQIRPTMELRKVLNIFRNALAHNNLHALGGGKSKEIEQLAFFSERKSNASPRELEGYDILILSVQEFEIFLVNWFGMLKDASFKSSGTVNFRSSVAEAIGSKNEQIAA